MSAFELVLMGHPFGKERPRLGRRGPRSTVFTPKTTTAVEDAWRAAWREKGSPVVQGAMHVVVEAYHRRKASHFLSDGVSLSAEGRRHPFPDNQKPDLDNVLKLVMDALNKHAYKDDVATIRAHTERFWTTGEERTRVFVSEVEA